MASRPVVTRTNSTTLSAGSCRVIIQTVSGPPGLLVRKTQPSSARPESEWIRAHDRELQRRVGLQALAVLKGSAGPGAIVHFQEPWPEPLEDDLRRVHPGP